MRAYFCLVIAFLGSWSAAADAARTRAPAKGRIELVYDADPQLCGAFVAKMNELHKRFPKAFHLGEVRNSFFRGTGFGPPPWIDQPDPQIESYWDPGSQVPEFLGEGNGYWRGGAFFRADVAGDGRQRLVHVWHESLGHHGEYEVTVTILKPGMPYRVKKAPSPFNKEIVEDIDPNVVDLRINFEGSRWWSGTGSPFRYPSVAIPAERIGFPKAPTPSEEALKLFQPWLGERQAQEAFVFGGQIYFAVGRPLRDHGLIYRVRPEMILEVVCLTAERVALQELKKSEY